MEQTILGLATMVMAIASQPAELSVSALMMVEQKQVLAKKELDLTKRLPTEYGAGVFSDNILLSLHYLKGDISQIRQMGQINWDEARKPFTVEFILKPNEVFAFHDNVLKDFQNPKVTMHSKFFMDEGYLALNGLGGNGVCHLASLINWVAQEAGLKVIVKVNHDFYPVPGVPRQYGTAIMSTDQNQNLYIKNDLHKPAKLIFTTDQKKVALEIW